MCECKSDTNKTHIDAYELKSYLFNKKYNGVMLQAVHMNFHTAH